MIDFFKDEDFPLACNSAFIKAEYVVGIANNKLEREGRIVYSVPGRASESAWSDMKCGFNLYSALLINIQPIEKCEHPIEKVKNQLGTQKTVGIYAPMQLMYKCECGAEVIPYTFKEIK